MSTLIGLPNRWINLDQICEVTEMKDGKLYIWFPGIYEGERLFTLLNGHEAQLFREALAEHTEQNYLIAAPEKPNGDTAYDEQSPAEGQEPCCGGNPR